ncbi:carbonic anhydrase-related protein 10-like [Schistocerca piceifrons]|uniref:carbonic anhydrase-related protein 10-like n=1 Tax=Schistocerca piceifrons TaxID=274613 RepID=UPI001F5FCCCC|nr:carbonic anhydrase-related protein 10-like [Schistocerca piceifrons]XP_049937885.1 carbonic anhydrase-related protein 10-like isoform X1 [Schistocerca serialis cubense]
MPTPTPPPTPPPTHVLAAALTLCLVLHGSYASWDEWWTYDGISGPNFWGRINPQWSLCNKGRRQSPIDVDPDKLLFDPLLRPLHIDKHIVSGTLLNTGQTMVFRVDKDAKHHVNISGGPLAYRYQLEEMYFHYGMDNSHGSEHSIHGYHFPGEMQMYAFNAELYKNMSEAQHKSQGIVGVAIMMQIREPPTNELRLISSNFQRVKFKGQMTPIKHLSLHHLLPDTDHYMTYEGSTTHPGCWETTVWIILNKPIYISRQEMYSLRLLMQGPQEEQKAPLGNNVRPPQHLHHRTVRTNIDFFRASHHKGKKCPTMRRDMYYRANTWEDHEPSNLS